MFDNENPNVMPLADDGTEGGGTSINYLTYPTKVMNITQSYDGSYNHYQNSEGDLVDYPIDEACSDTGRDWFYCPCNEMVVKRIYTSGANTIWLESTTPVVTPSGRFYVTIMVCHPEDEDFSSLYNGKTFCRNERMFREGNDGTASTGNHFHISVGKGHIDGNGWKRNNNNAWVLTSTGASLKPEQAFYLDRSFTSITNDAGLDFITL